MTLPSGRATNAILAITLFAFVVVQAAGLGDSAAFVAGFVPARIAHADLGGIDLPFLPVVLTPLSATLVHAGWLHIGFNALMLLFCGRQVEQVVGRWPMIALYGLGAYAAAAAQWAFDPGSTVPMVGASGAISALLGTYALLYSRQDVRGFGPIPANAMRMLWLAAGWVALQLLVGFAMRFDTGFGEIAVMAHIGGFVAGLLATRPLLRWRFRAARPPS